MIVYGDPSSQESLRSLVARLQESLSTEGPLSLDELRAALIQAGRVEQALEDAGEEDAALARRLTDAAAEAFLDAERGRPVRLRLTDGASAFAGLHRRFTVKTPEGFAFYGLYPEAYAVATERWLNPLSPLGERGRGEGNRIVVIGIRSIGTTLSAVVAAQLRASGADVFRLTARPTGHPFAREASLPPIKADWAIVVDEGPGLSGSSMASVAEALVKDGFSRDRIAFFPGHGGEPGAQASEAVRARWRETPRYVARTEDLRWDGLSLEETLLRHTEGGLRIEEMSDGRWREAVYRDPAEWPGVAVAFERRKLRIVRSDGSATLWKFVGLTVPGAILGFVPSPWVEGAPLRREDATPELVAQIGRHLAAVAGPPLSPEEARAAWDRLEEMLRTNAAEAGLSSLPPLQVDPLGEGEPGAGDYRLAPWEWRRTEEGEIVKAGRIAPTLDHTIVGRQPLAWDVAGAMVEWGLEDPSSLPPVADLGFYRAAYAAFRMGQCAMFAGSDEEGARLARDAAFYRTSLEQILAER